MGRLTRSNKKSSKSSSSNHHSRKKKTTNSNINNNNNNNNHNNQRNDRNNEKSSWVDRLQMVPVVDVIDDEKDDNVMIIPSDDHSSTTNKSTAIRNNHHNHNHHNNSTTTTSLHTNPSPPITITILTWNVLACAYCSRRSQVQLPKEYNRVVFHKTKRKQQILQRLRQLTTIGGTTGTTTTTTSSSSTTASSTTSSISMMDIVCLQEVDMNEIRPIMEQLGYRNVVETPRCTKSNNTTMGGRLDGCSIYIRTHHPDYAHDPQQYPYPLPNENENTTDTIPANTATATIFDGHDDDDDNDNDDDNDDDDSDSDHTKHQGDDHERNPTNCPNITPVTTTTTTATSSLPPIVLSPPLIQWKLIDSELIRLDDLATLSSFSSSSAVSSSSSTTTTTHTNHDQSSSDQEPLEDPTSDTTTNNNGTTVTNGSNSSINSNIQGIQQSLLRRNMAIMIRLQHTIYPKKTIIVINAHLFWNPSFEYVKLCQAHYILLRAQKYQRGPYEPVVLCGDLNSRPNGVTHTYLSHGFIDAKRIAPWYNNNNHFNDPFHHNPTAATTNNAKTPSLITDETASSVPTPTTLPDDNIIEPPSNNSSSDRVDEIQLSSAQLENLVHSVNIDETLVHEMSALMVDVAVGTATKETGKNGDDGNAPQIRYLLDASLNKLCRWLRILGQDAAIETDDEEKLRTGKGEMVIFDRCKNEQRTLVTTSPRLMQRRDCPTSVYCIHPPYLSHLEVVMVHMLLSHGVELIPSTFLSRCVVCNGKIIEEHDDTRKRQILTEYEAPHALIDEGMAVFVCDGCQQGYWWNDRPTSSASRVKTAATRLLELCVRAGVPIRDDDDDGGMFQHVNYRQLREEGWDYTTPGSELLQQKLDVIEWLKCDHLKCPFPLESAYLDKHKDNKTFQEMLPFTNITHHFVDTLDYIFFDKTQLHTIERLQVPTSFDELSDGRTHIDNAHLLPSDVWPSDHLAIAARLAFHDDDNATATNIVVSTIKEESEMEDKVLNESRNKEATSNVTNGESNNPETNPILYCGFIDDNTASLPSPPPVLQLQGQRSKEHVNDQRCGCGCIPSIPSLFEMAELRKQAKLKAMIDM